MNRITLALLFTLAGCGAALAPAGVSQVATARAPRYPIPCPTAACVYPTLSVHMHVTTFRRLPVTFNPQSAPNVVVQLSGAEHSVLSKAWLAQTNVSNRFVCSTTGQRPNVVAACTVDWVPVPLEGKNEYDHLAVLFLGPDGSVRARGAIEAVMMPKTAGGLPTVLMHAAP